MYEIILLISALANIGCFVFYTIDFIRTERMVRCKKEKD